MTFDTCTLDENSANALDKDDKTIHVCGNPLHDPSPIWEVKEWMSQRCDLRYGNPPPPTPGVVVVDEEEYEVP